MGALILELKTLSFNLCKAANRELGSSQPSSVWQMCLRGCEIMKKISVFVSASCYRASKTLGIFLIRVPYIIPKQPFPTTLEFMLTR